MSSTLHITARLKAHASGSGMKVSGTVTAVNNAGIVFKAHSAVAAVESSTSTASLAGMTLVFQEEFDGGPLLRKDGGKFYPYYCYYEDDTQPDHPFRGQRGFGATLSDMGTLDYPPAPYNPLIVTAGVCHITTIAKSSTWTTTKAYVAGAMETSNGPWWESADVRSSRGGFEQKYGYWEIKAKIPYNNKGIWSAFWLNGGIINGQNGVGEIDIFEGVGDGVIYQTAHHFWDPEPNNFELNGHVPSFNASADFHVYGMKWTSTEITWWVDGVKTHSASPALVSAYAAYSGPLFMMIDSSVGGSFPGDPDGTTVFPSVFSIDYVRVYTIP